MANFKNRCSVLFAMYRASSIEIPHQRSGAPPVQEELLIRYSLMHLSDMTRGISR